MGVKVGVMIVLWAGLVLLGAGWPGRSGVQGLVGCVGALVSATEGPAATPPALASRPQCIRPVEVLGMGQRVVG